MQQKTRNWMTGIFAGVSAIIATPFLITEVTGTDYCLEAARSRDWQSDKVYEHHLPDYDTAKQNGLYAVRLALTAFHDPSDPYTPSHASLEFIRLTDQTHSKNIQNHSQIHGLIVDAKTGKWSGISPCDAHSWSRQFHDRNILKGSDTDKDLNQAILGHDPFAYIDLFYGTEGEIQKKFSNAMDATRELNAKHVVYGFQNAPNSNTFVAFLMERLKLPFPEDLISNHMFRKKFFLPGFEKNYFPATTYTTAATTNPAELSP
jgi:hypothetical protein